MRRLLLLLIATAVCLSGAGCGTSSTSTVSTPLASELSYFTTGSPFVAAIATAPQGTAVQNAQGLLGASPYSRLGITAVESELGSIGINYQTDIEPLYGNPVSLGVLQVPGAVSVSGSNFLAVWVTESASKLTALVKKLPELKSSGTLDGATIYRAGSSATFAVDGATVVFGTSAADVDAALGRHAHGGGITSADFATAMGNLPQNTVVQAFGSLTSALSGAGSATARKIPWVAAIRSYAAAITDSSSGITAQFRIDTSGGTLSSTELPIAGGTAAPSVAGSLPIAVGVRDPAQILSFAEAALQAADPSAYAKFVKGDDTLKRKTGSDLNTFAALLTGNLAIQSDTKVTMGRADVTDPASAAKQLALLPPVLRDLFPSAKGIAKQPGGFYAIKQADGQLLNLGLVGNQFVAGNASPARLRAFAAAPTSTVPNAQGSVAFRIGLLDLLKVALKKAPSPLVQTLLATLGDISGSASASPSALTGNVALAVK